MAMLWAIILRLELVGRLAALGLHHPAWHLQHLLMLMAMSCPLVCVFAWRRWQQGSRLMADADTDGLTGLNNRRKTERLLEQEFDRALRYGRPLALVMFDVDNFKHINDTLGHPVGDLVLAGIARRIKRKMRTTDYLGRWGGEEFLLICPETDTQGATQIAERMRRAIRRKGFSSAGVVTASFGVGCHSGEGNVEVLIQRADQYLYAAKQRGRDCVVNRLNVNEAPGNSSQLDEETSAPGPTTRLSAMLSTISAPMRRARTRG
jgi:diguanylate cyclase (GGDEF)-like protein